jgi:Flp pilus assembly protein TadG
VTTILKRLRSNSGQAMVEFALIVPILLVLMLAIFQFGVIFNDKVQVTNASRDAVRKAAVSRTAANGVADAIAAAKASAPSLNKANMMVSVSPGQPWTVGQDLTVTVTYPGHISILGIAVWSGLLTATTSVRVE